ncbi:MAG: GLPGLI family protein [Mediterranea sp.]|jgi:GLPGLI family protein|nr:GLPGLI family protein [Mediterranea sp.]
MRKIYSGILLFFVFQGSAQNIDSVKLRVHYAAEFKRYEISKRQSQDEKILDVGSHISKFYSLWETKRREVSDSILSNGGSFQDVMNALERVPYPRSHDYYTVYKNYPQKGKLTYTDKVFKDFIYEETFEKPEWDIISQDTLIVGYNCQKAQTHYRGRTWDVWFTPAIPINDGPWKLCGLPGLILYAKDSKGDFLFECIEIENGGNEAVHFPKRNYIKCTWKELNQMKRRNNKDPVEYLKQFGIDSGAGFGPDGKPLVYKEKKPVLLEY